MSNMYPLHREWRKLAIALIAASALASQDPAPLPATARAQPQTRPLQQLPAIQHGIALRQTLSFAR